MYEYLLLALKKQFFLKLIPLNLPYFAFKEERKSFAYFLVFRFQVVLGWKFLLARNTKNKSFLFFFLILFLRKVKHIVFDLYPQVCFIVLGLFRLALGNWNIELHINFQVNTNRSMKHTHYATLIIYYLLFSYTRELYNDSEVVLR